jgi:1,4-alpha-glucan branching enzyme
MPKITVKKKRLIFSLEAPGANEVILMADFNKWNKKIHAMKKDNNGTWTKTVIIPSGRYEYKYLVDGEWWNDPKNHEVCYNQHGSLNNIITVQ